MKDTDRPAPEHAEVPDREAASEPRSAAIPPASLAGNLAVQSLLCSGGGAPLSPGLRQRFEPGLGSGLAGVRLHTGELADAAARSVGARAYALGSDVVFKEGQFAPDSASGQALLAHELTHVVEQQTSGPVLQRQPETAEAPGGSPALNVNEIPLSWVREPNRDDILVFRRDTHMAALPAQGAIVLLQPPPGVDLPTEPLFTVPTVAKEGLIAVHVGQQTGFLIDAGGRPAVVLPAAMAAAQQALGIQSIRGVVITHIHEDHVRSLTALVRQFGIRPENLHYPEVFTTNPSAPGSTFAAAIREIRADPALSALGHGPAAAYSVIRTPASGALFYRTLREGNTTFEFFGLSQEFRDLEAQRRAGRDPTNADPASLLTRVTHEPSGFRWLYVGDLRGATLAQFREAMGETAYTEMLRGVRVIEGLQHHLGALESRADLAALSDLLARTYFQSGRLTVIAQSQERYGRAQFLNRSFIEALRQMGIDVEVALGPGPGGQVGTITVNTEGVVTHAGGGSTERFAGSTVMRGEVERLIRLRTAAEILTRYERFIEPVNLRVGADARQARDALETAFAAYRNATLANVRASGDPATGRGQPTLQNQAVVDAAAAQVRATYPVEQIMTPAFMGAMQELSRLGPHLETWERELPAARRTGRFSEAAIEALWEFSPEQARRLVSQSGAPRRARSQALGSLPGQPLPFRSRLGGGVMIAITLVNELAPAIQSYQAEAFDDNVLAGLNDIMWWQAKGVFPSMEGVNDRWWPRENQWTSDPARIQEWLNSRDLDYLALTGIDDRYWDAFGVWATTHLNNLRDWYTFIERADDKTIRYRGTERDRRWEFRTAHLRGRWYGHDLDETWVYSERLTTIMNAALDHVYEGTEAELHAVGRQGGPVSRTAISAADSYQPAPLFQDMPRPIARKRFAPGRAPRLYTLQRQERRTGYSENIELYVFPDSANPEGPTPEGYVLVGGANYSSYAQFQATQNVFTRYTTNQFGNPAGYHGVGYGTELLLARIEDLVDAPR